MFTAEPSSYIELLQTFPPRPIKSEEELIAAQNVIDTLLDSGEMTPEKQDYINVLGLLIYEYEEEHVPIPDLSGVDLLKALIDELGVTQSELAWVLESEAVVADILEGQRQLTVEHIEKLANFFNVSPAVFFPRSSQDS